MKKIICLIALILLPALCLAGCDADGNAADSTTPTESTTSEKDATAIPSQVQQKIQDYFTHAEGRQPCFAVQSYDDLKEVFRCADQKIGDYTIEGNWREAQNENSYDEKYFDSGYIVVVMTTESSMNYSFEYSAQKQDGKITVFLDGTRPMPYPDYPGAYLFILSQPGTYEGEQFEVVETEAFETMPPF